jgi:F-type H+-transporting ATPase subunit delta
VKASGSKRIAERYVKALFDVAQSASATKQVEDDMQSLVTMLADSEDFRNFLINPLLSSETQGESMLAILAKMHVDQVTRQFIGMLVAQKRLAVLPEIAKQFIELAASARGEMSAEVISAVPLKAPEIAQIAEKLGKAYGRKMNIQVRQNPELLGGVIVKIGSQQLDSSLAGKMRRLKNALQAA